MRQSQYALRTNKDVPKDAHSVNANLLCRGGFIQHEMSGVYSYLPLGLRVLQKIQAIIREEMESVGSQEVLLPALTPRSRWEQTGRQDTDIAYTPTKNTVLGWSHEEMITPIAKNILRSHKDFPKCLYQIQTKFRNEPRAKSGLLRGREFCMKDAYSFHTSQEDLDQYYEQMAHAYMRVYERCGLYAHKIESGGGEFSKKISHEFSVIAPAGEDTMIHCPTCAISQNDEVAVGTPPACPGEEEKKPREEFENIRPNDIEETAKLLNILPAQILKTVVFVTQQQEMVGVCVRGDVQISEDKVSRFLRTTVRPATPSELKEQELEIGFISPVDNTRIRFVYDTSVPGISGYCTGANEKNMDYRNVYFGRDFSGETADFALVTAGFSCQKCGGILESHPCIEAGNIFDLGTQYSESFGFTFSDADGKPKPVLMGCYGIGVSRLMGTAVEVHHDDAGIIWPEAIAPFQVHVLSLREDDVAYTLTDTLESMGFEVLCDDRDETPGKKFADSDLIGIPFRIVVSQRTLKTDSIEIKNRRTGEAEIVVLEDAGEHLKELYSRYTPVFKRETGEREGISDV